jgi:hypothetical protein
MFVVPPRPLSPLLPPSADPDEEPPPSDALAPELEPLDDEPDPDDEPEPDDAPAPEDEPDPDDEPTVPPPSEDVPAPEPPPDELVDATPPEEGASHAALSATTQEARKNGTASLDFMRPRSFRALASTNGEGKPCPSEQCASQPGRGFGATRGAASIFPLKARGHRISLAGACGRLRGQRGERGAWRATSQYVPTLRRRDARRRTRDRLGRNVAPEHRVIGVFRQPRFSR